MDAQDVFKKINFIETNILNKYYADQSEETWGRVAKRLYKVMRQNRISEKRIKKIFSELGEHNGND